MAHTDATTTTTNRIKTLLSRELLSVNDGLGFVQTPSCGAVNVFLGTVRDTDTNRLGAIKRIRGLYYEAYDRMAVKQTYEIVRDVLASECGADNVDAHADDDNLARAYVAIRAGFVPVGQASILICVSSKRRHQSHRATMIMLERIKAQVAIWKRIHFADGQQEWIDEKRSEASWLPVVDDVC